MTSGRALSVCLYCMSLCLIVARRFFWAGGGGGGPPKSGAVVVVPRSLFRDRSLAVAQLRHPPPLSSRRSAYLDRSLVPLGYCRRRRRRPAQVTDMCSFYHLPSTVIGHAKHRTLNAAYSFYNVATTVRRGRKVDGVDAGMLMPPRLISIAAAVVVASRVVRPCSAAIPETWRTSRYFFLRTGRHKGEKRRSRKAVVFLCGVSFFS